MSCARYYILLGRLYKANDAERALGRKPGSTVAYQEALARVRVHAEDCEECIDGIKRAFPELAGEEFHTQSLLV